MAYIAATNRPEVDIEPDAGAFVARLASAYGSDIQIRKIASSILHSAPAAWDASAYSRAASSLYGYVKKHFQYVPDRGEFLVGIEDVYNRHWVGDCDDATMILGALMSSVGIPSEVVVIGNAYRPYHAVLRANGTIYDVTGVVNPISKLYKDFRIWGVYPVDGE
jgi:transglutaminase-like putative cysteine protease